MLQNGAAQAFEDAYVLQELFTDRMKTEEVVSFINAFEKKDLHEYKVFSQCLTQKFKLSQIQN